MNILKLSEEDCEQRTTRKMVEFLPKDIYLRKGCLGSRFGFHQRCQESFCQIEVRKFVLDRIAVPVKSNPDHTPRRSRDNDQNMKNFTCTLSMWQLQVLQRKWILGLPLLTLPIFACGRFGVILPAGLRLKSTIFV